MVATENAPTRANGSAQPPRLRASAQRIQNADAKVARSKVGKGEEWQAEAWEYFDDIGMVKQVIYFRGNQMAKFRIFPAVRPLDDPEGTPIPVSDPESGVPPDVAARAMAEIERIKGASGGTPEILRLLDMNNEVAGEAWIVGRGPTLRNETDPETGDPVEVLTLESWEVRSVLEVRKKGDGKSGHWEVQNADTGTWETLDLDKADTLVRVWQRHPAHAARADCHMRAILTDCEALVLLTNEVKAESKSRQNNGLLFIPNSMTVSAPTTTAPASQDSDPDAVDDPPDQPDEAPVMTIAAALGESMLDPISDPSSAWSVEPRIISGPAEDGQHIRYIELNRKASERLEERIAARKEAIAQGLNAPVEVAKGHQDTTFCADPATEILTTSGWRHYTELAVGDLVLTLDHRTGLAEWQPTEYIQAFDVQDESMLAINGKAHDSLTTANHRWPIFDIWGEGQRSWQTSETLKGTHRILTAAQQAALPTETKYTDEFVEIVAWHWTEGHVYRHKGTRGVVTISQSGDVNPAHCDRIRGVLTRMLGAPQSDLKGVRGRGPKWTERRDKNRNMRRFILSRTLTDELEAVAPFKVVTPEFVRALTAAQLELFIDVSLMADGTRTNMGSRVITQSKPEMLDGIELATILSGRTPYRWQSSNRTYRHGGRAKSYETHHLAISDKTWIAVPNYSVRSERHAHREWVKYSGTVWCPTTRNGTWMARRNGKVYFTGNSNAAQIDEDIYEKHLQPSATMIVDMWLIGLFRPAMAEAGVAPDLLDRLIVWFDAADVLPQVNPADHVKDALDTKIISKESARRFWGFSDDDAPAEGEFPDPVAPVNPFAPAEDAQVMPIAASAKPSVRDQGKRLADGDRMLMAKTVPMLHAAMTRALERAGNRLKAQTQHMTLGPVLRPVHPMYAAQQIGPAQLAAFDVDTTALIDDDAFDREVNAFHTWSKHWQQTALGIAAGMAGLTAAQRKHLAEQQAAHLADAAAWMNDQLHSLAQDRLFQPDPQAPARGEFDPTSRVPMGLVRTAVAIAGGAVGMEFARQDRDPFVAMLNDTAPGGIGTGQLITDAITAEGTITIEGWQWDYGDEPRMRPYEPHVDLDGVVAESKLDFGEDDFGLAQPGNHDGCACSDLIPVYAEATPGEGPAPVGADLFGED